MVIAFLSSCIAAAAMAVALVFSGQDHGPAGLCVGEHGKSAHDIGCYFSESYFEARAKFRQRAEAAGATLHALPVIPEVDPSYTIDVAVLEGRGEGLVVSSSGVHGVEGFAGSAVQLAYLAQRTASAALDAVGSSNEASAAAAAAAEEAKNRPTVVLVHAVNPFGMAHYRRFNEHNVDLNRNALHPDEWPALLARDPNIAG